MATRFDDEPAVADDVRHVGCGGGEHDRRDEVAVGSAGEAGSVEAEGREWCRRPVGLLLVETIRAAGLDRALSAGLAPWRKPLAVHDPAKVVLIWR